MLFRSNNAFAAVLAFLLALLVAQSRVEARIHTVREVVMGAVLALFLTASVYRIPSWAVQYLPGGKAIVQPMLNNPAPPTDSPEGQNAAH